MPRFKGCDSHDIAANLVLAGRRSPAKRGKDELRLLKFSVAATILVAWVCGPAAMAQDDRADNRGTPEQRAACTSDAFRYCSGEIPDAGRVEDCLRQRKAYLSDACRSAFEPRSAGSRAR